MKNERRYTSFISCSLKYVCECVCVCVYVCKWVSDEKRDRIVIGKRHGVSSLEMHYDYSHVHYVNKYVVQSIVVWEGLNVKRTEQNTPPQCTAATHSLAWRHLYCLPNNRFSSSIGLLSIPKLQRIKTKLYSSSDFTWW